MAKQYKWQLHEEQFIRDNHRQMTYKELAKALERTEASVYSYCWARDIKCPRAKGRVMNRYRVLIGGEHVFTGNVYEIMDEYGNDATYWYTAASRGTQYDLGYGPLRECLLIYRPQDQKLEESK